MATLLNVNFRKKCVTSRHELDELPTDWVCSLCKQTYDYGSSVIGIEITDEPDGDAICEVCIENLHKEVSKTFVPIIN